jgi:hypothetical protein
MAALAGDTPFDVGPMSITPNRLGRLTAAAGQELGFDKDALNVRVPTANTPFYAVDRRDFRG